jgi:hypothetical protein
MSDSAPYRETRKRIALALLTLISAGEACAGDLAGTTVGPPEREIAPRISFTTPGFGSLSHRAYTVSDPLLTAPSSYALREMPETKTYSSRDFRPRGRSVFDADPRAGTPAETLTVDKDLGQRLKEYKSRDHVRVLTLWETGASAISIQTDRKGDPSLQWTSRLMNRGGATQGLLDRLFPVSVFGGTTHVTRSATSQPSRVSGALSSLHFGSVPPP